MLLRLLQDGDLLHQPIADQRDQPIHTDQGVHLDLVHPDATDLDLDHPLVLGPAHLLEDVVDEEIARQETEVVDAEEA